MLTMTGLPVSAPLSVSATSTSSLILRYSAVRAVANGLPHCGNERHKLLEEESMASRKDRVRRPFLAVIQPQLDVGEEVVASGTTWTGPKPWIMYSLLAIAWAIVYYVLMSTIGLGGAVGGVIAGVAAWPVTVLLGRRPYFMAVTDRRVFLVKASSMLGRPRGMGFIDLRSSVKITSAKSGVFGSQFAYSRSDAKPMIMHFSRPWRKDVQTMVRTITGESRLAAGDEAARS